MADVLTPEQRHRCMKAIKGKDTKPEIIVRKYLFSRGLRYRVNNRKLPGSPDIVLKKYKTVVFVDGCFWHAHRGCKYYRLSKSNVDFWRAKIARNIARDYVNNIDLELAGWNVIRIWECEIRTKATREEVLQRLYDNITQSSNSGHYQSNEIDNESIAAEPIPTYGKC
ncbi:MAG: very short patch repair endonuclease [Muribaculaceae bacterium]|nr:very short patch repair endonuclease [Muribaculaceae bacterium]